MHLGYFVKVKKVLRMLNGYFLKVQEILRMRMEYCESPEGLKNAP